MSDGLDNIIKGVQDIVGAVSGIRCAPDYAPAKLPPGVSGIVLPANGTWNERPSMVKQGLHNVNLFIMCPWADSQKVLTLIIPFGDLIAGALLNDRDLGGSCETYEELSYTFGPINWNAGPGMPADAIGFTFTIGGIKHHDTTSITSTTT